MVMGWPPLPSDGHSYRVKTALKSVNKNWKKVAKRPSADPSVIKRPANETVLKRPSAKQPASAIEDDAAYVENQARQRDRNKDGWLKRNLKSLPEGVVATIEKAAPGPRTDITNAIVENSNGSWNFNLEHPIVQEVLRKEEGSYYKKGQKGVPFEIAKRNSAVEKTWRDQ